MKTILIGEKRIPNPDHIRQQKLLREQQSQPTEGKILWLYILLLLWDRIRDHPDGGRGGGREGEIELKRERET